MGKNDNADREWQEFMRSGTISDYMAYCRKQQILGRQPQPQEAGSKDADNNGRDRHRPPQLWG